MRSSASIGRLLVLSCVRATSTIVGLVAAVSVVLSIGTVARPAVAQVGPVLHLTLDDGAGSGTALDSSGNGLDGQLFNMDPATDWVAGVSGLALDFDGFDDFAEVTDDPLLDFGTGDFSVSCWAFKRRASVNFSDVYAVSKWSTGAVPGSNEWVLTIGTGTQTEISDRPLFAVETGAITYQVSSPDPLSLNLWHHLVGVRQAENLRIYVDGVFKGENAIAQCGAAVNNAGRDLTLARNQDTGFLPASDVVLDDIQIYGYALDDGGASVGSPAGGEVATLFNNPGQAVTRSVTTTTLPNCPAMCGDATRDGEITATDALVVLQVAVGQFPCLLCICDVNDTLTVTATDALDILRFAVGSLCRLSCPGSP